MKIFHFFGDSVTLGVNDAAAGGWVARLAGKAAAAGLSVPPDTFYNMGVRRNSSRMILDRWEHEFKARTMDGVPSFLLFCFGTVDMAAPKGTPNIAIGESAANAREILMRAKTYGATAMISARTSASSLVFFIVILLSFLVSKTFLASLILYKNVFVFNALF